MIAMILQVLRELGNVFDEQELRHYLEDPWITDPPKLIDQYLNGDCDQFAIALNQLTSWPLYAVYEDRLLTDQGKMHVGPGLVHAFVSTNHCVTVIDIKGERPFTSVLEEYGLPPCTSAIRFNGILS